MSPDLLSTVLVWLATYALHSTLLLALAWILTSVRPLGSPRLAETVWRSALFGGLLTASVHVFAGAPLWQADLVEPTTVAAPAPVVTDYAGDVPEPGVGAASAEGAVWVPPPLPEAPPPTPLASRLPRPAWLLLLWPLGTTWLVSRHQRRRRRLQRDLASRMRVRVRGVDATALLARIATEAGVRRPIRLSVSQSLSSPVAFGIARPEICLPARALETLPEEQLEAMLAHEVAHLARRDPVWLVAYRTLLTLFFFQPLNHHAVRRLHDAAELDCDAWAAAKDDRRLALAACLTTVAGWILERAAPKGVSAMALRPSLLGRRVRRLLDGASQAPPRRRSLVLLAAVLPLVLVLALTPGVTGSQTSEAAPDPDVPFEGESPSGEAAALALLDEELAALDVEIAEVQGLLREAGHGALAERLEARRAAVLAKQTRLARAASTLAVESR